MSGIKIGWYLVDEEFGEDAIEVSVFDSRDHDMVTFKLDDLESHTVLIERLETNQQMGSLKRLAHEFGG